MKIDVTGRWHHYRATATGHPGVVGEGPGPLAAVVDLFKKLAPREGRIVRPHRPRPAPHEREG